MYRTLSQHYRSRFGCKVYKLAIDAGFTCPNRDGTLGTGGCSFCSAAGGGDFPHQGLLSGNSWRKPKRGLPLKTKTENTLRIFSLLPTPMDQFANWNSFTGKPWNRRISSDLPSEPDRIVWVMMWWPYWNRSTSLNPSP